MISHKGDHGRAQGTGFYGIKSSCSELNDSEIPSVFRLLDFSRNPIQGTSLFITGFLQIKWRERIACSVIENFFYAILSHNLMVMIEPNPDNPDELFEIDSTSLGSWFNALEAKSELKTNDPGNENALHEARMFWEIVKDNDPSAELQDHDLGHIRLWIRTAEGLPGKVGLVRGTGMLVTTKQRNLIRFPGFRDFLALCVFEDPDGNEILRKMENPKHDQFEPERLMESEKKRGRQALKRISDWIRSEVKKQAGPPQGAEHRTVLAELATYLPDYSPEEPFEDAGHSDSSSFDEPGFGERVTIRRKPVRRPPQAYPSLGLEAESEGDEDENDTGDVNGGNGGSGESNTGGGGGPNQGTGIDGTGTHWGRRESNVRIYGVRILPVSEQDNLYEVSFFADKDGPVRLILQEAGDSSAISRADIRSATDGISLEKLNVSQKKRTSFRITADAPIGGRAWRVSAMSKVEG